MCKEQCIVKTSSRLYRVLLSIPAWTGLNIMAVRVEQDCHSYVGVSWNPKGYWQWRLRRFI